ncbi:hypothetical protein AKJ56_01805 [candidate division MSBL1 archaeon SCGC-AAA382N08]|uniref:Uncharacterized protein n=1 Tax=candidate division MSBL1 archaeon SCGC-AAA382N08 TaxID=1698285 RepID=A0A133VNY4_9EURY|nr:hypothetical protein AKJ56_01805 [candidate division MSBL1 archaeon SCGC-AAA382N08]
MGTTNAKIIVSGFLEKVNISKEEVQYDIPSGPGEKEYKLKNLFPDVKVSEKEIQKAEKELFTDSELST